MLKEMFASVDGGEARAHGEKLRTLSSAFGQLVAEHGFSGDNCHQICEDRIVIDSEGQPHHEVVCRIVCT